MDHSMPGFPVHHQLLELAQTHVLWVSDAIQPSHPLLSFLLLSSIFPSIRVFSKGPVLHIRWPKYWSLSISPSNEYSGLISFKIDWFDLLAVQGTLKSLLQHHSSKASILWCSVFFKHKSWGTQFNQSWILTLKSWIFCRSDLRENSSLRMYTQTMASLGEAFSNPPDQSSSSSRYSYSLNAHTHYFYNF